MSYRLPTVKEYYILKYSPDAIKVFETARAIAGEFPKLDDFRKFYSEYIAWVDGIKAANPLLQVPYYPEFSGEKRYYTCVTWDIKTVSDYTGLNFKEIYELTITQFWSWLRDAFIYGCEKTEQGLEYLEKAYYNSQTDSDREEFRKLKGASRNGNK